MKTTILSEAKDGTVTVTVRLPFKEASMLLDVVTDAVLFGNTKGVTQEFAEELMRDLDDHMQRAEQAGDPLMTRKCPCCGAFNTGTPCHNCGE